MINKEISGSENTDLIKVYSKNSSERYSNWVEQSPIMMLYAIDYENR